MVSFSTLISKLTQKIYSRNSKWYVKYLRKKGVEVGDNTQFFGEKAIDITRPCLVEIGNNCVFTDGVKVLTHGYDWSVLREKFGEVLCSSGKVVIEDNVFIGTNSIILKGVRIGRDSVIGAGSVVTRDIPAGSVAAGNPCKAIMTIDEYYQKRKIEYINEAKAYAFELYKKTKKIPKPEDFWEEFPLFLNRTGPWGKLPVKQQVGSALDNFLSSKPIYGSFEDFLMDAGIPVDKSGAFPTFPRNNSRKK
jgi:acetyltransferase-like isoleucine patch superfamily enzyme